MRLGVLGAAKITPKAVLGPARELPDVEVVAVAARDPARAEAFAAEHGIPRVHTTYRALVEDPELDAVYVALPASEHAPWSVAALGAGRHVLCEKPFALNADQAVAMVQAARRADRHLVEAMHWRYHPVAGRLIDLADRVGPLREAEATFEAALLPGDIRFQRDLGGGATMDIGCYAVHWLRFVAGEEPEVLSASAEEGPPGVDAAMYADLRFPSGLRARLSCAMRHPDEMEVPVRAVLQVTGEGGRFRAVNPQAPQFGNEISVRLAGEPEAREVPDGGRTYPCQLRSFARIVRGEEAPRTGGDDAVATMRVIDDIYEASGLGRRDDLARGGTGTYDDRRGREQR